MKEKYLALAKKSLLSSPNKQELFFQLLNHFEIKVLKKFPDFNQLKISVIPLITSQELFEKVAIKAVRKKKINTLKFIMDECKYDLTKTVDPDKVTLLHEACLYGDNEIVEYLLKKGFNPNAQDFQGETPLQRVLYKGDNLSLIALLKQYKANLDVKGNNKLTPLFLAILYKNSEAAAELIKLGAKKNIKCLDLNYIKFREEVENGTIKIVSPKINNLSLPQENLAEQAIAKYYQGCLLPQLNQAIFREVKAFLLKKPEMLNKNEAYYLINALILTSEIPFQPKVLVNQVLNLIQMNKLSAYFALFGILESVRWFAEQHEVEIVSELNEFVLSQFDSKQIPDKEVANFYFVVGVLYKQVGLFLRSEDYLKQAIIKLPTDMSDQNKMEIFFNLGCTQSFLMKEKAALESFKTAFYLKKDDFESFQNYLSFLLKFEDYQEAENICSQSSFDEYSKIYAEYIKVLTGDSNWEDLLKILDRDFSNTNADTLALDLKANCCIYLHHYNQAINAVKQSFSLTEENFKIDKNINIAREIFKVLYIYMQAREYGMGLIVAECLEKKYSLEFGYSVLCNSAVAVFYLANQQFDKAEISIRKIHNSGADPEFLSYFYLSLAAELLSDTNDVNYDMAMHYINLVLEIDPNHFKAQLYKLFLSILQKDWAATKNVLKNLEPQLSADVSIANDLLREKDPIFLENRLNDSLDIVAISSLNHYEQEENIFIIGDKISCNVEEYDPIKIHNFFKAEKSCLLNETIGVLSPNPKPKTKWQIGSVCFEEGMDGLVRIQHPRFPHCYAVIHPHLKVPFFEKFETALRKSDFYQSALSENVSKIPRKCNDNVQTLNNSIVQLKIHEDNRLWTDRVYHADGKYLLVFDHHDYHPAVRKKAREGKKIQVIDLSENQLSFVTSSVFNSGIFAIPPEESSSASKHSASVTNILNF